MTRINQNSIFYHLYPLGACNAPHRNDFNGPPVSRLQKMLGWLDHIQALGANAIYLGPVFESTTHGYDTANYYEVDRRLGTRQDLRDFALELKRRGMALVLDGVFNHVGRDFWAFKDLLAHGQSSAYKDWFAGLRFDQKSPYGDPFSYEAWSGHFDLVKLNLAHPEVKDHLFGAIAMWKEWFDIDGIRLDAADVLSFDFMRDLRTYCDQLDPELWLMGEVIHGDYRRWANPQSLHATTNYELYKAFWSALNDGNFFELAHSLGRQFGTGGMYLELKSQYNFVDNHDVSRITSQLRNPAHLGLVYLLMYCAPGLPSVYYGSEFGFEGFKQNDDWNLRPPFDLLDLQKSAQVDLRGLIARLSSLRQKISPLRLGDYRELLVSANQYAFAREAGDEITLIVVNSAEEPAEVNLPLNGYENWRFVDALDESFVSHVNTQGFLHITVPANWGRVLLNRVD